MVSVSVVATPVRSQGSEAAEPGLHPLDPLTASELGIAVNVLREKGHWDENTRFPMMTLHEPVKTEVLRWQSGQSLPRRAFLVVKKERKLFEAVVDVQKRTVDAWEEIEGVQPGILLTDEWLTAQRIVRRHPGWREAVGKRGFEDVEDVELVPMTAGYYESPLERNRRIVKVVSYDARDAENYWSRPIEGLIATVDLDERSVVNLQDTGDVPVPSGPVDFGREPPEGQQGGANVAPAGEHVFVLDHHWVTWQGWRFHWRVDPRLGLVVSLASFEDGGKRRAVLYQGSLSEMFVPYTDPDPAWYFRAFMDAGEYGIGRLSSRLVRGLDCPANARFLAAVFSDDWGNPHLSPDVACVFERYAGDLLWRHHEGVGGATRGEVLTELVLRQVPTIGNYDYVLDWVFRPEGSIRVRVGATGVPAVKAVTGAGLPAGEDAEASYGRRVAPNTVAINHDHFFSFRLDLDVDGPGNSLLVDRLRRIELDDDELRDTTWVVGSLSPATEKGARLRIDLDKPALWRVVNPTVRSAQGLPVSYQLRPGRNAVSLFGAEDILQKRAGFTDYHLWVTPYARNERYAAGTYPNQSRGGDGLPGWTSRDRPVRNTDIVLWYTLGMHHVVRTEDWPVMPTSWSDFELRPFDFFERNPALEGD